MAPPTKTVHTPKTGRCWRSKTHEISFSGSTQKLKGSCTPIRGMPHVSNRRGSKSIEFHVRDKRTKSAEFYLCEQEDMVNSPVSSDSGVAQIRCETPKHNDIESHMQSRALRRSITQISQHNDVGSSHSFVRRGFTHAGVFAQVDTHLQDLKPAFDVHTEELDLDSSQASDESCLQQSAKHTKATPTPLSSLSTHGGIAEDMLAASLSTSISSTGSLMETVSDLPSFGQMLVEDNLKQIYQEKYYFESLEQKLVQEEQVLNQEFLKLKNTRQQLAEKMKHVDASLAKTALEQGGGPMNWGISVQQLVDFMEEIKPNLRKYCGNHRFECRTCSHVCLLDPCPHKHGCAKYRSAHLHEDITLLPPVEPNMHTVVDLFIKPRTQDCHGLYGLALKINQEHPKAVQKFISHSWSGRFEDLVATLNRHLLPETVVFICSFALPQNLDLNAMVGIDLERTPFAVAHKLAREIWVVIDESVDVLQRAWVVYELYLSLDRKKPLRIALTKSGAEFQEKTVQQAHSVDVRCSKASKEADLKAIRAKLAGMEDALNDEIRLKLKEEVHREFFREKMHPISNESAIMCMGIGHPAS